MPKFKIGDEVKSKQNYSVSYVGKVTAVSEQFIQVDKRGWSLEDYWDFNPDPTEDAITLLTSLGYKVVEPPPPPKKVNIILYHFDDNSTIFAKTEKEFTNTVFHLNPIIIDKVIWTEGDGL